MPVSDDRWSGPLAAGLRPGLDAIRRRRWVALRGDVAAGVTVAAYLVPQVIAYATVAGMPPVTSLWAALAAVMYTVAGTSRLLSIGPESTTAIMTAIVVGPLASGHSDRYTMLAATLAVMVGMVCGLGWVARLGFLADLLSRPVLVGYLAGISMLMIAGQLHNISGVVTAGDTFAAQVTSFATGLVGVHVPTVALSAAVLAVVFSLQRWLPRVPGPLVAVLLAAGAVTLLTPGRLGVSVVGPVPGGLPVPTLPQPSGQDVLALIGPAVSVALVAYSDTVVTGRAFVARDDDGYNAGHELLGLGLANIAAGMLRGFPISSSGSRAAIGESVGARSQLYTLVAAVVVVGVLFAGTSVLATFPTAALGALVVYAAIRLIDLAEFRRFARFRRSEFTLATVTTVAVIVLGVLGGVLVAVGLSILDLLRKLSRPHDGILGFVPGLAGMHDVDDYPEAQRIPGLVVYRYDAPLCFANADDFRRRAMAAVHNAPTPVSWLLLNTEAIVELDITAADALGVLQQELGRGGTELALARVKQDLLTDLRRSGLLDRIGPERIFPTLPTAVEAYRKAHP
jgi:high affinity sulfate transporter 1